VTGEGITVTLVTEPLVSVFGKEMRPGFTTVFALPWEEISDVSLAATNLEPDGARWLTLTVNATYGEHFEVHEGAGGFYGNRRPSVPDVGHLEARRCTIGVARCGLQRSFVRIFQVLRVALARSPMARTSSRSRCSRHR
jgi:hypothetical protein